MTITKSSYETQQPLWVDEWQRAKDRGLQRRIDGRAESGEREHSERGMCNCAFFSSCLSSSATMCYYGNTEICQKYVLTLALWVRRMV